MKKFNEITDYKNISCINKVGTEELKELHYKANKIIFDYNMQHAFPQNTTKVINQLTEVFIKIKNLEVKSSATSKKEELLEQGRKIVNGLKEYIKNFKYDDSCINAIENMCRFQLSKYLKGKDRLTITDIIKLLEENQSLYQIVEDVENNLNTNIKVKPFLRMQEELIDMVSNKLQQYSFN